MSMQNPPFSAASDTAPACRRCGICCMKGGPTLVGEDISRIVSGVLTLETLVCLRSGEWTRDDARNSLRPLERERIKIAGLGGTVHPWRCRFYLDGSGCSIYANRPAQCSALFCMDTRPLQTLFEREEPLNRAGTLAALADLKEIPGFPGLSCGARGLLSDLARAHEEQCPVHPALELAEALGFAPHGGRGLQVERETPAAASLEGAARAEALARLAEAARTDAAFRELCVERAGIPRAILPFLLGRPLEHLLAEVGLRPLES